MAMNKPAVKDLLEDGQSYYSLVLGVARLARAITDENCETGTPEREKPVTTAVNEFAEGNYRIVEPDNIGETETV